MAKLKAITIDGANPADACQTILTAAKKEGGFELKLLYDRDTDSLKLVDRRERERPVTIANQAPGTWRGMVMEFRRLAGFKAQPSGRATYQQGTIRNNAPKTGEVMGAKLFRITMNRGIRSEMPSRITLAQY